MARHHSNLNREVEPHALPDVETFYLSAKDFLDAEEDTWMFEVLREAADAEAVDFRSVTDDKIDSAVRTAAQNAAGWYYWYCFPGCLPDSEPSGPFATEQDAINDFQETE